MNDKFIARMTWFDEGKSGILVSGIENGRLDKMEIWPDFYVTFDDLGSLSEMVAAR